MEPKGSEPCPTETSSNSHQLASSPELNLLKPSEAPKIVNVEDDILQNKTSTELNLFGPSNQLPSESSDEKKADNSATTGSSPRSFSCRHCSRVFSTPQALGGHQNGHKQVRKDEKRCHSGTYHDTDPYNKLHLSFHRLNYYHPYTSYSPQHPNLYGPSVSSVLHRPNLRWSAPFSPCHCGNHNPTWSGPGPNEHRLSLESLQSQTHPSFPFAKPSMSLFDMGTGVSASQKTNLESGNREVINVDDEEEENARGLDLNLKL